MKGFILYVHKHGRLREGTPSVHTTVRDAVAHSLRDGGRIFRPEMEPTHWLKPVSAAIEANEITTIGVYGARLEYVVSRNNDEYTDVVAIVPCEVML